MKSMSNYGSFRNIGLSSSGRPGGENFGTYNKTNEKMNMMQFELDRNRDLIMKLRTDLAGKNKEIALLKVFKNKKDEEHQRTIRVIEEVLKHCDQSTTTGFQVIENSVSNNPENSKDVYNENEEEYKDVNENSKKNEEKPEDNNDEKEKKVGEMLHFNQKQKNAMKNVVYVNMLRQQIELLQKQLIEREAKIKELEKNKNSANFAKLQNNFVKNFNELTQIKKQNETIRNKYDEITHRLIMEREDNDKNKEKLTYFKKTFDEYKKKTDILTNELQTKLTIAQDKERECKIFHTRKGLNMSPRGSTARDKVEDDNINRLREAESEMKKMSKTLTDLRSDRTSKEQEIKKLKEDNKKLEDKCKRVEDDNKKILDEFDKLTKSNQLLNSNVKELRSRLDNTQKTNNSEKEKDKKYHDKEIKDLENKMQKLNKKISDLENKLETEKLQKQSTKELLDESEKEKEKLKTELTKLNIANQELMDENISLKKIIEELKAQPVEDNTFFTGIGLRGKKSEQFEDIANDNFYNKQLKVIEEENTPMKREDTSNKNSLYNSSEKKINEMNGKEQKQNLEVIKESQDYDINKNLQEKSGQEQNTDNKNDNISQNDKVSQHNTSKANLSQQQSNSKLNVSQQQNNSKVIASPKAGTEGSQGKPLTNKSIKNKSVISNKSNKISVNQSLESASIKEDVQNNVAKEQNPEIKEDKINQEEAVQEEIKQEEIKQEEIKQEEIIEENPPLNNENPFGTNSSKSPKKITEESPQLNDIMNEILNTDSKKRNSKKDDEYGAGDFEGSSGSKRSIVISKNSKILEANEQNTVNSQTPVNLEQSDSPKKMQEEKKEEAKVEEEKKEEPKREETNNNDYGNDEFYHEDEQQEASVKEDVVNENNDNENNNNENNDNVNNEELIQNEDQPPQNEGKPEKVDTKQSEYKDEFGEGQANEDKSNQGSPFGSGPASDFNIIDNNSHNNELKKIEDAMIDEPKSNNNADEFAEENLYEINNNEPPDDNNDFEF